MSLNNCGRSLIFNKLYLEADMAHLIKDGPLKLQIFYLIQCTGDIT